MFVLSVFNYCDFLFGFFVGENFVIEMLKMVEGRGGWMIVKWCFFCMVSFFNSFFKIGNFCFVD